MIRSIFQLHARQECQPTTGCIYIYIKQHRSTYIHYIIPDIHVYIHIECIHNTVAYIFTCICKCARTIWIDVKLVLLYVVAEWLSASLPASSSLFIMPLVFFLGTVIFLFLFLVLPFFNCPIAVREVCAWSIQEMLNLYPWVADNRGRSQSLLTQEVWDGILFRVRNAAIAYMQT